MSHRSTNRLEAGTESVLALINVSLPAEKLIGIVLASIYETDWPVVRRAASDASTPDPVLRGLCTYCYATGVYGSEEVAAAALYDAGAEYLAANFKPDWETIRDFRRRNAEALKQALAAVCRKALERNARILPDARAKSVSSTFAQQSLTRAIQADSFALDV